VKTLLLNTLLRDSKTKKSIINILNKLLLEDGSDLLLENGTNFLMEK